MDPETQIFTCLGAWFLNPIGVLLALFLQPIVNIAFSPLGLLGVTAPNLSSLLTNGACNF